MRFFGEIDGTTDDDKLWGLSISTNPRERASALFELGLRSARAGRFGRAVELLTAAIEAMEASGDDDGRGEALYMLASALLDDGRHEEARDTAEAASNLLRIHGDEVQVALAVRLSGIAHLALGEIGEAELDFLHAHQLFDSSGNEGGGALCADALAGISERAESYDSAVAWRRLALEHRQAEHDPVDTGRAMLALCRALRGAGELDECVVTLRTLVLHWRYVDRPPLLAETLGELGAVLLERGESHEARIHLGEASAIARSAGDLASAAAFDDDRLAALRALGADIEADRLEDQLLAFRAVTGAADDAQASETEEAD